MSLRVVNTSEAPSNGQQRTVTRAPRAPRVKVIADGETIRSGIGRDSAHCIFAEAVKAAYPKAAKIAVDLQTIRFSDPKKGLRYTYLTPRRCQIALVKFDQGIKPEPLEFLLRNGQVTRKRQKNQRVVTEKQKEAARKSVKTARAVNPFNRSRMVRDDGGKHGVPRRVGGQTPPLAPTSEKDDVPFTRRRAFGIRALEY